MLRPTVYLHSKHHSIYKTLRSSSRSRGARVFVCRIVTFLLAISLFSSSTPAAPSTIVDVSSQLQAELTFWVRANHVVPRLWNFFTQQGDPKKPQEEQS